MPLGIGNKAPAAAAVTSSAKLADAKPSDDSAERIAVGAAINELRAQLEERAGTETDMDDDFKLSPDERAMVEAARRQKAASAAKLATRETREQLATRILLMDSKQISAMSAAEREQNLSELVGLLTDLG